jgi:O-methyltransferase
METSSTYIDQLKNKLADYNKRDNAKSSAIQNTSIKKIPWVNVLLRFKKGSTEDLRIDGRDRPLNADTMIGLKRLDNIEYCVRDVIKNNVEGDFIELGVWRGGATILMRALLKEMNITDRNVWVADSFEGLPKPDAIKYPADKGDKHYQFDFLKVSIEDVKHNFEKYGLLDERVKFLKGWFKDTLPTAPISKLAVLRLDGDMYESTKDGLVNLYPKLSKGGYIIIDDWGAVPACKKAVEDYRKLHNITEEINLIDWTGVFWKKGENE